MPLGMVQATGKQRGFDVIQNRKPREEGETLEDNANIGTALVQFRAVPDVRVLQRGWSARKECVKA